MEVTSASEFETRTVGRRLASLLRPDDVVLLSGGLGVGKTAFIAGLAEGLGIEEPVTSPSFVLVHTYRGGFIPLVHADVYRLGTLNELADLELVDEAEGAILAIEWGDAVAAAMPEDHLLIRFFVHGDGTRTITFTGHGVVWESRRIQDVLQ
ncbi:MAG: tRNA (adenosine(37)-N6)-threonylcarbamoyltransferase complex ATPase subunit type 1 TsaE [Acidimicrobiia bacterium]